jgi:polysaccharide pyruvyl transferase WcaK-like protein
MNSLAQNNNQSFSIILWGGWYGSHNIGDQVLLLSIMDLLGQTLYQPTFTVISSNPDQIRRYTKRDSHYKVTALHNYRDFPKIVRAIKNCHLFIFGGGVPFYDQDSHLFAMAILIGLVKFFDKPYMTWTVTSLEIHKSIAKIVFKWILDGAKSVTLRDRHTQEIFQACGVKREMQIVADPGFYIDPAPQLIAQEVIQRYQALSDHDHPYAALTPRVLRGDSEARHHYQPKTQRQYDHEIACFSAALDWLWEHGYQPIFIPMNTVAPDDDRQAAKAIIAQAKHGQNAILIDEEILPRVAPAMYSLCQLSFVARVHGGILSAVGNCPMMMYAFDPKHAGIMQAIGMAGYAILEKEASPEKTLQTIAQLCDRSAEIQVHIRKKLAELRAEAGIPAHIARLILLDKI